MTVAALLHYESPVGSLRLVAGDEGLLAVLWPTDADRVPVPPHTETETPVLTLAARQLDQYFAGTRTSFDVPLAPRGTDFQRSVWDALTAIPFGATTTYGAIASQLRTDAAARAVGAAVGRNPISIIVPCHRVVGSDGSLTGFAGGIETKRLLLEYEGALLPS